MKQLLPVELVFLTQATEAAVIKGKDARMVSILHSKLVEEYQRLEAKEPKNGASTPSISKD